MATKTSAKRQQELELEVEYLKTRLKETIDAFTAIRQGEVDAFVVPSPQGAQVYILEGIERRYRAIVETMNVAALILSTDGTILYCNSQFAQMLDLNLSQVMGGSLQNLIAKADRERCAAFLRECVQWRSKVDLGLVGSAGKQIMAELSGSPLQLEDSTGVCLVVTDITERRRAEAALRQNERKLRLITENLRDTVFAYDMNRQLIFVNSTFEILTGYTIGELYARNFINYLHPDDATRMMSLWEDVFQGKAFAEEFRIVRKDGQIRWCASSWSPLLDEQGQQIGVQGRETDVTGRKRAEEALQESEEKYRTLVDNIPGSEFRCEATPPRRVILQSTEIENISGYPASDFLDGSIRFEDIELPEDVEKIHQAIESAIADKKSYIVEFRIRHADGSIRWVSERGRVTYSEQGEPLWLDGISFDITEQKQIEKALQESEERFRSFSEAAFEAIVIHEGGVLLRANDQFFEMFGYKPDELLGKQTISLLVAPKARKYMRSQIAIGGRGHYDSVGLRKDGTKFPMEIRAQDMEYKGRKVRVGVLRDITERIQAETEREALLQQVRASHDELRTLAAYLQTALEDERTSIAREIHDEFGQSLTALKMDLAWLSTRITPAEPQVQEKMAVMTSMLQELIQYSRQVASNLRPGLLDDLGLNAAIEWYANDWSARHGKGIFIHLPDMELPLNREMSTALYRILQETLTNVARHAEATRVDVYLEMADDHVILQVRDNGRGISQNEIHSSTALDLLGMRERAYQFGGGLEISAKPGKGTTVQVRLPLEQDT